MICDNMDEKEAKELLELSRNKIDKIDNEIIDLILKRTSLAKDIAKSKIVLKKDLFDSSRENAIHDKITNLLIDEEIDISKVLEIFDLLATINKEEQKKYLK